MEQAKEPIIERMAYLIRQYPSRSAAARAWGLNINTLQSYFKKGNTPEPRESILVRIAESEGVSLDWLKTGNGNPPKIQKSQSHLSQGDKLTEMLSFLTSEEREALTNMLARKGVEIVLRLLDRETQELLQLEGRKRLAALMLVDMPDERVREILEEINADNISSSVKSQAG
ncbi:hypothetical protein MN350_004954 [Escherichia coli]|uniref:hypothetical protein n=1 Tax=Escherichia coli TaxID=562 RepID=UPI0007ACD4CC|nr:hypothetical protein [Escherichia coli]EET8024558.1 hypothetical protein [Escherichia coli]EFG6522741.1 hypothetical protein [Escherichia coli]EFH5678438.1 hypothetical protein [Escherichia coli]EFH9015643.1 hypothetical protein [Escherichia coli]EFN2080645.1 hypothetical protein [Escherichia coli]